MDGDKFIKKINPQLINKFINLLSFSKYQKELSYSDIENLMKKKDITSIELDFLIKEKIKDFSHFNVEILIISYDFFTEIRLDTTDFKNFLKSQDLFKENLLIPILDENNMWSILFVKDFLSIFEEEFLESIKKEKKAEKMKLYYIHNYFNTENIMKNFKLSVEKLSQLIEYYLGLSYEKEIFFRIFNTNFSDNLYYKFIPINSLFNTGNMPLLFEIFKDKEMIEILREFTLNYSSLKSLKIKDYSKQLIKKNKIEDESQKQVRDKIEVKKSRNNKLNSLSFTHVNRNDLILSLINKNNDGSIRPNTISFKEINTNDFEEKQPIIKEISDNIGYYLDQEYSTDGKQLPSKQTNCIRISVDENNYEYLNTEESLNHNKEYNQKEENFNVEGKKEKIKSIIKEKNIESDSLDNNLINENASDNTLNKEVLPKNKDLHLIDKELNSTHFNDKTPYYIDDSNEEFSVNRHLNMEYLCLNKPSLEISKAAKFNYYYTGNNKKEFPYQIEDDDINFNHFDLLENYIENAKNRRSRLLKKHFNKEINQFKNLKKDNYLFHLKGRLNPSSYLDNEIKKELGFRKKKKTNNTIVFERINDLYDSEKEEIKGCLSYANSKCIIN